MEIIKCPRYAPQFWQKARCGSDRDCIPDDRLQYAAFKDLVCFAVTGWNPKNPTRFVEIWNKENTKRLAKITSRWGTPTRFIACGQRANPQLAPGGRADPEPFTVDIPGIQDIIKVKAWESKELKRERYERFQTQRSAVPDALKWIPPLLTKLDNAQDMLFTGLALAIPLIRLLGPKLIPGIGLLLTINDILNLFT